MKTILVILSIFSLLMISCGDGGSTSDKESFDQTGQVDLYLTDAPADDEAIQSVIVSIEAIQYQHDGQWKDLPEYQGGSYDLLQLQNGVRTKLGSFNLPQGDHQLRIKLQEDGAEIHYTDGSQEELPLEETVIYFDDELPVGAEKKGTTLDFDVRKSLVADESGEGLKLKPSMRMVDDEKSGQVQGSVENHSEFTHTIIYAYHQNTYVESEAEENSDGIRFANAVTSVKTDEHGHYNLAYLEDGAYELIIAGYNGAQFQKVLGTTEETRVKAQQSQSENINTAQINQPDTTGQQHGKVELNLTDAPIDDELVAGVYISIKEIQYNINGDWKTLVSFEQPEEINLLDLQNGKTLFLGNQELPAGHYDGIRFLMNEKDEDKATDDAEGGAGNSDNSGNMSDENKPEESGATETNSGSDESANSGKDESADNGKDENADNGKDDEKFKTTQGAYIMLHDGTRIDLFVPSGDQSGYKAVGSFDVIAGETVSLTADFDVQKSVVVTGNDRYILKPTIRLVTDQNSGDVEVTIEEHQYQTMNLHIYRSGDYKAKEAEPNSDGMTFSKSTTSKKADGVMTQFNFLEAGTYLIAVEADGEVIGFMNQIEVQAGETLQLHIDPESLDSEPLQEKAEEKKADEAETDEADQTEGQ